ncbi:fused MFS/spermidine synthase [Nocardioides sp. SOB77]|uniref:Fused MFS/spermidine synthase n=1 Tax=Nocardioides oceani TaxID=3058369 RepID=A0ABT8FG56_9ACTN|nr:fused MFS/spermidine synthase [Nocardioides oceani]MDN4173662.1 fused MFS/spermidine synthase [Nocardioides oceani]
MPGSGPPAGRVVPGPRESAALVFGSSAAVLVVELVALRLLAPYLGLTLETNTLVIGLALAAIALGSWAGGRAADVVDPRRALAPLLGGSGVVVAATPFLVRGAAESAGGSLLLLATAVTIGVPGALLSAVTPMVTKLALTSLAETGTVVGRLSGIGTAGSIVGTVLTGFVLVSAVPISGILVGLGVLLALAAVVVGVRVRGPRGVAPTLALVLAGTGLGGLAAAVAPGGCDVETQYHCARVDTDPERSSGRVLVLDGLRHSYVDLSDATHLEFEYVQAVASVVDAVLPAGEPLAAYHLGGGGLTLPRYLAETRPGTTSLVSEIDPGVVAVDRDLLGLETGPALEVRVEDGRLGLASLADNSRDLVVGDAFGGVSVPWHLTTREAVAEVRRVLRREGVYAANLIDHGPLAFARAEVATLREVFDHVALVARPGAFDRTAGGNVVVVASDEPLDLAAVTRGLADRDLGWEVRADADLDAWVGDADVLTDDRAPVDQLLTPFAEG